jgi:hypothetical protein
MTMTHCTHCRQPFTRRRPHHHYCNACYVELCTLPGSPVRPGKHATEWMRWCRVG